MEISQFKSKGRNDLLAESIRNLLETSSEQEFLFLIGQQLRGGKGKTFKNYNKQLPSGSYQELEVNGAQDSRRIIVDDRFGIFATRDHYETISYAGKPDWAE